MIILSYFAGYKWVKLVDESPSVLEWRVEIGWIIEGERVQEWVS